MEDGDLSYLARLSDHLAGFTTVADVSALSSAVVNLLRDFVQIDEVSILSYPLEELPVIDYREQSALKSEQNLDTFVLGAFVLDPYYVAATRHHRTGFFTLAELAPTGFQESEYYRTYYRYAGLEDECGYLFTRPEGGFTNISLARTSKDRQFSPADITLLKHLAGTLGFVYSTCPIGHDKGGHSATARLELDSAIQSFGSDNLTRREHEIVSMILHGYAGKSIASTLGISIETVKLHRRSAYQKLSVRSQGELFHAFINSLVSGTD